MYKLKSVLFLFYFTSFKNLVAKRCLCWGGEGITIHLFQPSISLFSRMSICSVGFQGWISHNFWFFISKRVSPFIFQEISSVLSSSSSLHFFFFSFLFLAIKFLISNNPFLHRNFLLSLFSIAFCHYLTQRFKHSSLNSNSHMW